MYSRDVRQLALHWLSLPLTHPESYCKEVIPRPEGKSTEIFSSLLPEQGAKEWRGGMGGVGEGRDLVSGNKNSNPASPKPWVTSFSSNRSVWWVNISIYGEAGWRMSEKSPFCPLALEEHAPLKTEFLTRSKCLTPKEVESKLSRMLHHPNKGGTSLKVYKLTLEMGSWENTTTFMKSFY